MKKLNFSNRLLLIDGNSLINRAFFALPPLTDSRGNYTNAVYGFTTMLLKAIGDFMPKYIAVCFDLPHPTFRHLAYTEYKANRRKMPEDLASQMPLLKDLLKCMNITIVEKKGYEADDLIGTIATRAGVDVIILSGDKDNLQLINDRIKVCLTRKGLSETVVFDEETFRTEYGFAPINIIDLKALMGDSSDNIPGIAGIGEKTALRLIYDYGTLDAIYQNLDKEKGKLYEKLTEGRASAYMSYELATINKDAPIEFNLQDFIYSYPFEKCVKQKFKELNFKSLLSKDIYIDADGGEFVETAIEQSPVVVKNISNISELSQIDLSQGFSILIDKDVHIATDIKAEYKIKIKDTLISDGSELEDVLIELKSVLENPNIVKTVFDYKALKHFLKGRNINLTNAFDIQLAQYVVDSASDTATIKKIIAFNSLDENYPAVAFIRMKEKLQSQLKDFNKLFYEIEMPLAEVLFKMEETGFKLDINVLKQLYEKYNKQINDLSERIYELAGERFNINSPKQLGDILYNKLKLASVKVTKTKALSTDAEALEKLREENEIIDYILKYRTLSKLNSTYVEGLIKSADDKGVVRTIFRQTITSTGRLSSTEPNLQNIPVRDEEGKEIRRAFVAREGYTLVTADYSQIELRLLAHFSKEPKLLQSYINDEDIHTRTASEIFGVSPELVSKAMRREAKAVNFGIIYGISDFGLARGLGIPVSKARQYIKNYFANYPKVKEYLDKCVVDAKAQGKVTLESGRVRNLPELKSTNPKIRQFGERAAMNMHLQGTAADLIKLAMIKVDKEFERLNLKSRLILQVHDELIAEAYKGEEEIVERILKEQMETAITFAVPITVEISKGNNWYDLK